MIEHIQLKINFYTWSDEDIITHPCFNLSLKKLYQERERTIEFNNRISLPGYKFKKDIKPNGTTGIDRIIERKLRDERM